MINLNIIKKLKYISAYLYICTDISPSCLIMERFLTRKKGSALTQQQFTPGEKKKKESGFSQQKHMPNYSRIKINWIARVVGNP
jgi:hypothetical protein